MAIHLDPLGGLAGDMFAAALLDLRPELVPVLEETLGASGLDAIVTWTLESHTGNALAGRRVHVKPARDEHPHRDFAAVRALIAELGFSETVRSRAVDIFARLAGAEAKVHGIPVDSVHFHEVGAWDSIADVLVAAWLIEQVGAEGWSCAPLPLGAGSIETAHGRLPVPAPATARLLEGMQVVDDGVPGERVTPTGAAIIAHLEPVFGPRRTPLTLRGSGLGFGHRTLPGMDNVLRVLELNQILPGAGRDRVAVIRFEVDDQSPEDLAVALDNLRAVDGVLDVTQGSYTGKKGRQGAQVQAIARVEDLDAALDRCFIETTTLGARYEFCDRAILAREQTVQSVDGRQVEVKRVRRPGAAITGKAGMDDVAAAGAGRAGRERVREVAQARAAATRHRSGT